jgi:AAA+ ATPase superfamily predicted ATPase
MTSKLISRVAEQKILQEFYNSEQPEFLAIYGRRRIGKTFLVKKFFENKKCFFFCATGIQKGSISDQISRFVTEIGRVFYKEAQLKNPDDWFGVFDLLAEAINKFSLKKQKLVLFLDEFPWMVTHKSKLLTVIEYFWNQYWSTNPRIKLIICGSSASWIIKKIINNKGGLHNRITRKIRLSPFNLQETKLFLLEQGIKLTHKQITQLYMVTGGIPYYLSSARKGLSATQIIQDLAFKENNPLFKEFDNLFSSLFDDAIPYVELIRIISRYHYGIAQEDIIKKSKYISRGGRASDRLHELEEAGFLVSFTPYSHKKRGIYYRIIDEYILFYLRWIEPIRKTLQKSSLEEGYWEKMKGSPAWYSWSGYAFESICYKHLSKIRKKLNIDAGAIANTWRYVPKLKSKDNGAQIDLLFDRRDDTITICEIKYSETHFIIDKKYAADLIKKRDVFVEKTKTKKQIFIAIVASSNIKENSYSSELIDGVVTLDDLF